MKVFHEAPLSIMGLVQKYTDGEYILPHLLDKYPEYLKYMDEAKSKGRYLIMDNSLHELGVGYSIERLKYWVNEFKPDEFIVNDVWEEAIESVINAELWNDIPLPSETTKVAVVQAKSINEAEWCYQQYKKLGYKKIAFSYGASYYNELSHCSGDYGKMLGRIVLLKHLWAKGIIENKDRIHLLGCALPQEFKEHHLIESIDTSNPVMAAMEGSAYTEGGLDSKPKLNMNSVFERPLNQINEELVKFNIDMFRKINLL